MRMRRRKMVGIGFMIGLLAVSIAGNTVCFFVFETGPPRPTIGDSLWYSIISISTIGYGDFSAQSLGARLGTVFFIVILGLTTFGLLMAFATDAFVSLLMKGERGMGEILTSGHTIIVNFPGGARVRQIIRELQSDPDHEGDVVVVTDQTAQLPFTLPGVHFIYGSPLEAETFDRANLKGCSQAIILAISYTDTNSDPVVSSIASLIERLHPPTFTVVECLDPNHQDMFRAANVNSIVTGLGIAGNLLAQEMKDPGVAQTLDVVTSNLKGTTFFSTEAGGEGVGYHELAKSLLDRECNLVSVVRGEETFTTFKGISSKPGDRVVYVGSRRIPWSELVKKQVGS